MLLNTNSHGELALSIIKCLYYSKHLSCVQLSKRIGKSIPLVNRALIGLIKKDIVLEVGYGESSGGRKPMNFTLNHGRFEIVTVIIDYTEVKMETLNLDNRKVVGSVVYHMDLNHETGWEDQLSKLIIQYLKDQPERDADIIGIGIGVPESYILFKGIVAKKTLADLVSKAIGLTAYVDNNSRLFALAEMNFGSARSNQNALIVNYGSEIGFGLIVEGKLVRGHTGLAGAFAHVPISGKACRCDRIGCLDSDSSIKAILAKAQSSLVMEGTAQFESAEKHSSAHVESELFDAAMSGDTEIIQLFAEAGFKFGKFLAVIIHILNPGSVILTGSGARAGKFLLAPIQHALNINCNALLVDSTEIKISEIAECAPFLGAASLVMENYMFKNLM